ncbi:hypothetical protein ACWDTI_04660 [Gordonia sp. NPDC003424]
MSNERPTVSSLDARMSGVEDQLTTLTEGLTVIELSLQELNAGSQAQADRLWSALGSLGGLDGVATGLAEVAEYLAPIRQFAPPTTAVELDDGVAEALGVIRDALGGDRRTLNFNKLVTDWDGPVGFIGEVPPPSLYEQETSR